MINDLEDLWAALLSEDDEKIRQVWADLAEGEAGAVKAHLKRMAGDDGYSEVQRRAAKAALEVIESSGQSA